VDPGSPPPKTEKFSPKRLKCGPPEIPVTEREPLVTTMGSAFTDGVRVNIRKAHNTISIFDMEFSSENITGSMEESRGCQKYETREETVNLNAKSVNAKKGTSII
jgi:hypothetical protein